MVQIDEKQYARELAAINERLSAIEEAIRNLTIAIKSLATGDSSSEMAPI